MKIEEIIGDKRDTRGKGGQEIKWAIEKRFHWRICNTVHDDILL